MILAELSRSPKTINQESKIGKHTNPFKAGFTDYVLTCKEWQAALEKHNFSRLTLHQNCISSLERLAVERQRLIRRLWLRIELRRYNCSICNEDNHGGPNSGSGMIARKAIMKLFLVLSEWNRSLSDGLTLEISIHSPSDSRHTYRGLHTTHLPSTHDVIDHPDGVVFHQHNHAAGVLEQAGTLPIFAFLGSHFNRLFSDILINFPTRLPLVACITDFQIRRHTRRQLSASGLKSILISFPNLRNLSLEVWNSFPTVYHEFPAQEGRRPYSSSIRWHFGHEKQLQTYMIFTEYVSWLGGVLTASVRTLSVFEDFVADPTNPFSHPVHPGNDSHETTAAGYTLATKSPQLEYLSSSFLIEASGFFDCFSDRPELFCPNLTGLALTSYHLNLSGCPTSINSMLKAAACAVRRMPKLRKLEIWNGAVDTAGVFRFVRGDDESCGITWCGTWRLPLDEASIDAWRLTALKGSKRTSGLTVDIKVILANGIKNHGDAIARLGLDGRVIQANSLHQIRSEAGFYYFP